MEIFNLVYSILIYHLLFPCVKTVDIHKEGLWPKGKKVVFPDPRDPKKTTIGILERNPVPLKNPEAQISYYLFPKKDPDKPVVVDLRNIGRSTDRFDPDGVWVFGIHGFDGDYTSGPIFSSTARGIHAVRASNVIQVDWKNLAAAPWYLSAKDHTRVTGMHLAATIHNLIFKSLAKPEKIHIIGFSLGAHAAGYAGKTLVDKYRLKFHRVTGLDPAGPGYDKESKDNKLDPTDGRYVEVFHTCGGFLGTIHRSGHVDFYVNGGVPSQPGCSYAESLTLFSCSHMFALDVFARSINSTLDAHKCRNMKTVSSGDCDPSMDCEVGFLSPNCPNGYYYLRVGSAKQSKRRIRNCGA